MSADPSDPDRPGSPKRQRTGNPDELDLPPAEPVEPLASVPPAREPPEPVQIVDPNNGVEEGQISWGERHALNMGRQIPWNDCAAANLPVAKVDVKIDLGPQLGKEATHMYQPTNAEDYQKPAFMVVGPQGSGKSSLIKRLGGTCSEWETGPTSRPIGQGGAVACTKNPCVFQVAIAGSPVHLIDMPGFNEDSVRHREGWLILLNRIIRSYGDNFKGFIMCTSDEDDYDSSDVVMVCALAEVCMEAGAEQLYFYPIARNPAHFVDKNKIVTAALEKKGLEASQRKALDGFILSHVKELETEIIDKTNNNSESLNRLKEFLLNRGPQDLQEGRDPTYRPSLWGDSFWLAKGKGYYSEEIVNLARDSDTNSPETLNVNALREGFKRRADFRQKKPVPGEHV